jgi:hypothetical protein
MGIHKRVRRAQRALTPDAEPIERVDHREHGASRRRQVRPVEQAQTQIEDVVWAPRRSSLDPAAPVLRRGDRKLAGVAGAVVALTVGLANILPGAGSAQSVVMDSPPTDQLHGITSGETLPPVDPQPSNSPSAPRPVDGPVPLTAPSTNPSPSTQVTVPAGASMGIPSVVLAAYESAADKMAKEQPGCHLPWALLAGIGEVESGQADNGAVNSAGELLQPILGPALNGAGGFALVLNTDPAMDGSGPYARAVGPMQFLPSTWQVFGQSATGHTPDPENIFDAALTTATFLCDGGGDLSSRDGLLGAVYRYNQSWQYVSLVLTWAGVYAGSFPVTVPGATPTPSPSPTASTAPKTPKPTASPVPSASAAPSPDPTPTLAPPTGSPTPEPTAPVTTPVTTPTPSPTGTPAPIATSTPTPSPTGTPSPSPTASPTGSPTPSPTDSPTPSPTPSPTGSPTPSPTDSPTPLSSP